jgi:hypothetical protein
VTRDELIDMIADHYHGHGRYQAESLADKLVELVAEWIERDSLCGGLGVAEQWREDTT